MNEEKFDLCFRQNELRFVEDIIKNKDDLDLLENTLSDFRKKLKEAMK